MEPIEYMSSGGHVETVTEPQVAVRLRARGWWPLPELREQAAVPGPAADWLKRAEAAAAERKQREADRENPPTLSEPPAEPPPLDDRERLSTEPQTAAPRKPAAKKPAK